MSISPFDDLFIHVPGGILGLQAYDIKVIVAFFLVGTIYLGQSILITQKMLALLVETMPK